MWNLLLLFLCTAAASATTAPPCFGFLTSFAGLFSGSQYTSTTQSVYGSELALIFIAEGLARESGQTDVDSGNATVLVFVELNVDEVVRGVRYLHSSRVHESPSLLGHCETPGQYTALVVSRYLNVFLDHNLPALSPRVLLWLHDTTPIPYHTACSDSECISASLPNSGFTLLHSLLPSLHSLVTVGHYQKRTLVEEYGFPADRVAVLPNGLAPDALVDDVATVLSDSGRIPNSFIFSSSPVRQLDLLLGLWPDILEVLPDATLRIFYTRIPDHLASAVESMPSVTVVGKVSHTELLAEFRRTMFWLYPAKWCETCCSTAFETAVSGVIQMTSSTCALRENVRGVVIPGTPGDGSWSRHALQVIRALGDDPALRDVVRQRQYEFARQQLWSSRARVWYEMLTAPDTRYNRTSSAYLDWSHDHWLSVPVDLTNRANWPFCYDWTLGEQHDFVDMVGERWSYRPPGFEDSEGADTQ
jgi:hypothetical protein